MLGAMPFEQVAVRLFLKESESTLKSELTKGFGSKVCATAAGFIMLALLLFLSLSIAGVIRFWHPIPFWDMWDGYVRFWLDAREGGLEPWWRQHNDHRIPIQKLLFWLDLSFAGGKSLLLVSLNLLVAFATSLSLVFLLYRRLVETRTSAQPLCGFVAMSSLVAILSISWIQRENFTWGFQTLFLLASLLPLLGFFLLARSTTSGLRYRRLVLLRGVAMLLLALAPWTISGGLVAPFLGAALVFALKLPRRYLFAMLAIAVTSLGVYLVGFQRVSHHADPVQTLRDQPMEAAEFILAYLGSPIVSVTGNMYLGKLSGLLMVAITVGFLVRYVFLRSHPAFGMVALAFLLYVLATAALTSLGRLNFGLEQSQASRYQTPVLVAWACVVILISPRVQASFARNSLSTPLFLVSIPIILAPSQVAALVDNSAYIAGRDVASLALSLGVADPEAISTVYPDPGSVLELAKEARRAGSTLFAYPPWSEVTSRLGSVSQMDEIGCTGFVDSRRLVDDTGFERLSGWVDARVLQREDALVPLLNDMGRIVGFAVVGFPRQDVVAVRPDLALHSGFVGYIKSGSHGPISLAGLDGACRMATSYQSD